MHAKLHAPTLRTVIALLVAFVLSTAACSADDELGGSSTSLGGNDDSLTIDGNDISLSSALSGFENCDDLLGHLRTEGQKWVTAYGFNESPFGFGPERMMAVDGAEFAEESMDVASTAATDEGGDDGAQFSETNTQEVNVDEADVVKTDGQRLYVIAAGKLSVIDVESRDVIGQIGAPDGWKTELFLSGDHLVMVSQGWTEMSSTAGISEADDAYYDWSSGTNFVRIGRYDVAADGTPTLIDAMTIDGDYLAARAVDGVARIAVQSQPQARIPFVFPTNPNSTEAALAANQAAVAESTLDQWLPSLAFTDDTDTLTETTLPDCGSVHAPNEFAGPGVISLINLPLDRDAATATITEVIASGSLVYGSTESIYVTTTNWFDVTPLDDVSFERFMEARRTSIHQFSLSPTDAAYHASGSVPGNIRNQFSLSEHEGHLRVVTTSNGDVSESFLRVLTERDGTLTEVGVVGNLGKGEQVQSVRMTGDTGYVVTFRQIDPFYTLDLSDPTNPTITGELKIPGFSSYLHPINDTTVIGVGADADTSGRVTGAKVSLFDVSDPANPQETSVWVDPNSNTDVGWEHRSFLWWEAERIAVVPIANYETSWAGVVILRVDGDQLTELGRIDHLDLNEVRGVTDCYALTRDDLSPEGQQIFDTEFAYLLDENNAMLRCGPGDTPAMTGYDCNEDSWLQEEAVRLGVTFAAGEYLLNCWDNRNNMISISRSMVIGGDELWTVSGRWGYLDPSVSARVQVNGLTTLDRLAVINLEPARADMEDAED